MWFHLARDVTACHVVTHMRRWKIARTNSCICVRSGWAEVGSENISIRNNIHMEISSIEFHFWPLRKSRLEFSSLSHSVRLLFLMENFSRFNFTFSVIKFLLCLLLLHVFLATRCSKSLNFDRHVFVYFIDNIARLSSLCEDENRQSAARRRDRDFSLFDCSLSFQFVCWTKKKRWPKQKPNWNEFRAVCSAIIAILN